MSWILLIVGLILFLGLVVVHEFGHYIAARRNGVVVEEFGIGFPPKVWGKHLKNGVLFTVNWLPLGGFVRLKGEHDADTAKGSYGAASLSTKVKIMLAGVGMNLLTAFLLLTFLGFVGLPTIMADQYTFGGRDVRIIKEVENKGQVSVQTVTNDMPAAKSGIQKGDILVSINNDPITQPDSVRDIASRYAGQTVDVQVRRNGETLYKRVQLSDNRDQKGFLGIVPASNESGLQVRRFTWSSPIVAIGFMRQITSATLKGLGSAVKGLGSIVAGITTGNTKARQAGQDSATRQVSGPLGIFLILKDGTRYGLAFILTIIAIISLTLAIMNVLPIPALDGGRLFVTLFYRLIRRPLTKSAEDKIHGTGFAVLMLLIILISVVDVRRYF